MDECLGPATFFLTLSCAEYKWNDCRDYLLQMNQDVENVEYSTNSSLNISDPASVSIHFQNRFQCFFKTVIMNKNGPLGEVIISLKKI